VAAKDFDPRVAYDQWHKNLRFDEESGTPWHSLVRQHVHKSEDLAGRTILEIGCGRGEFSCWLAAHPDRPLRVIGCDFSLTAVATGASYGPSVGPGWPSWLTANIEEMPFADASFDTVFSCETVEHVARPRVALRELARVLRPGGHLFLTTPNYLNVWGVYRLFLRLSGRRFAEAGQPVNKLMFLPRECWRVRRIGLRILRVDGLGHFFPRGHNKPAIKLRAPDRWHSWTRWIASQTLILAEKPVP
jgi:2-polyprenyl-3-methyl-5-hydroxy-6-metoxy-1,4-benzoquinol methylase